jgi:putative flippase GtrA
LTELTVFTDRKFFPIEGSAMNALVMLLKEGKLPPALAAKLPPSLAGRIPLLCEFARYLVVGGISFVVDFAVLFICREYLMRSWPLALYWATLAGFLFGLAANYLLSMQFVFLETKNTGLGKSRRDMAVFAIIGLIGLDLSELGMMVGAGWLGFNYLIVKCVVVVIVLLWNYSARKVLFFNVRKLGPSGTHKDAAKT